MISKENDLVAPRKSSASPGNGEKEIVVSVRNLNASQIRAIDRALREIGDFGEVHLIVNRGRLRFIGKLTTQDLMSDG
jgi:hypothetical protein